MKKVRVKKPIVSKPVVSKSAGVEPELVDYTKAGFSNVAPDSPQARPFVRKELLPSQILTKPEGKSL